MNTTTAIIMASVLLAAVLGIAVAIFFSKLKTEKLPARFGPEDDRAVDESGGRRQAETGLKQREKHVASSTIRPLAPHDRDAYVASWRKVQAQFVDDPKASVIQADQLLADVMSTHGYALGDFEQRSADVSVDHPMVVENYRAAHEIATRPADGETGTEDLRRAMILYRTLFDELVGEPEMAHAT